MVGRLRMERIGAYAIMRLILLDERIRSGLQRACEPPVPRNAHTPSGPTLYFVICTSRLSLAWCLGGPTTGARPVPSNAQSVPPLRLTHRQVRILRRRSLGSCRHVPLLRSPGPRRHMGFRHGGRSAVGLRRVFHPVQLLERAGSYSRYRRAVGRRWTAHCLYRFDTTQEMARLGGMRQTMHLAHGLAAMLCNLLGRGA